jgi:hypothetical protein
MDVGARRGPCESHTTACGHLHGQGEVQHGWTIPRGRRPWAVRAAARPRTAACVCSTDSPTAHRLPCGHGAVALPARGTDRRADPAPVGLEGPERSRADRGQGYAGHRSCEAGRLPRPGLDPGVGHDYWPSRTPTVAAGNPCATTRDLVGCPDPLRSTTSSRAVRAPCPASWSRRSARACRMNDGLGRRPKSPRKSACVSTGSSVHRAQPSDNDRSERLFTRRWPGFEPPFPPSFHQPVRAMRPTASPRGSLPPRPARRVPQGGILGPAAALVPARAGRGNGG